MPTSLEQLVYEALRDGGDETTIVALLKALATPKDTKHMSNPGYTDKTPPQRPPIHVTVYGTTPPRAAEFGKGARDLAEIKEATDARRAQQPGDAEK